MNKVIVSQDSLKVHFMPTSSPCYFDVAPVAGEDGGTVTAYSVGVNNVSFGVFVKKQKAEETLTALSNFLLDNSLRFRIPADR